MKYIIKIKEPYWKHEAFGVKIPIGGQEDDIIQVTSLYKNRQGEKVYPEKYELTIREVKEKFVQDMIIRNNRIFVVPINQWRIYEDMH